MALSARVVFRRNDADRTQQALRLQGSHATTAMGCNLFMELDLATRKWRRLTGYVRAPEYADYTCPGPRNSASSWVSADKKRIFLLFGHADREGAGFHGESHGAGSAYGYTDMWSWDIDTERWRRERMSGNPPCARTETGYTYVRGTSLFSCLYLIHHLSRS